MTANNRVAGGCRRHLQVDPVDIEADAAGLMVELTNIRRYLQERWDMKPTSLDSSLTRLGTSLSHGKYVVTVTVELKGDKGF